MSNRIWIRRAYEPAAVADGHRVLVDRLWPRGVRKDDLRIEAWTRDLAPSEELRHWFGHDPARWAEFRTRYRQELAALTGTGATELEALRDTVAEGRVTLVFAAHDIEHNNAVVLREILEERGTQQRSDSPTSTRSASTRSASTRS
jgi:uncharacterized protein YeaO (DUF488 family)